MRRVETWDALRSRRDVREYSERPLSEEDLDRILEAGRRAPSGRNRQPWDFVVVTDREQLVELARVWQGARHVAGSAATVAVVLPDTDELRAINYFDAGQAVLSMMIAAADLGIGSAHAGVTDYELTRRVLGLPEDRFCAHLVALGHPAGRPLAPLVRPDRRPFDDVVHRGRW
jgi:nitroreductase